MTYPSTIQRRLARKVRIPLSIDRFTGLNDDANHGALLDSDLREATNLAFYDATLIGSRPGSHIDPFGAALNGGAPILGIFDYKSSKDTVHRPIVIAGNAIYEEDDSTDPSTATAITGATAVAAGQNAIFSGTVFNDQLIITQRGGTAGTHVPIVIGPTGNAAALSGWFANSRTAEFVHSQFGYVFFGGFNRDGAPTSAQNAMNVAYSELQDATAGWNDTRFVEKIGGLSVYGDEYVTGMFKHRDLLMIGTNRRIYPVEYTGKSQALFAVQRPLEVGLASQHSVVSINGEFTFFMDPSGYVHAIHEVARGFGSVGVQNVSRKLRNLTATFSRAMIKYVVARYVAELGYCVWSVPVGLGATAKNAMIVMDINDFPLNDPDHRLAKWTYWTGIKANVLEVMTRDAGSVENASEPTTSGAQYIYFGTETGVVKRFTTEIGYDEDDTGADVAIPTSFATRWFDFGQPDQQKSVVELRTVMEPAQDAPGPNARIEYDFGARRTQSRQLNMSSNLAGGDLLGSTFVLGASFLGSGDATTVTRDYFRGGGAHASVLLEKQMSGTQKWRLQQLTMVVEQRGEAPQIVESTA